VKVWRLAQDRDHLRVHVSTVMNFLSSVKGGGFLDYVSDCQFLKDSAPWS
jgi:hypothetical protein